MTENFKKQLESFEHQSDSKLSKPLLLQYVRLLKEARAADVRKMFEYEKQITDLQKNIDENKLIDISKKQEKEIKKLTQDLINDRQTISVLRSEIVKKDSYCTEEYAILKVLYSMLIAQMNFTSFRQALKDAFRRTSTNEPCNVLRNKILNVLTENDVAPNILQLPFLNELNQPDKHNFESKTEVLQETSGTEKFKSRPVTKLQNRSSKSEPLIGCPVCFHEVFTSFIELKHHLNITTEGLNCPLCNKRRKNLPALINHLDDCPKKIPAECIDLTDEPNNTEPRIRKKILPPAIEFVDKHEKAMKKEIVIPPPIEVDESSNEDCNEIFYCSGCPASFKNHKDAQKHINGHKKNNESVVCHICNRFLINKKDIISHLKSVHNFDDKQIKNEIDLKPLLSCEQEDAKPNVISGDDVLHKKKNDLNLNSPSKKPSTSNTRICTVDLTDCLQTEISEEHSVAYEKDDINSPSCSQAKRRRKENKMYYNKSYVQM